eukprot:jgi/Ulvmu1/9969/UM059_0018.1
MISAGVKVSVCGRAARFVVQQGHSHLRKAPPPPISAVICHAADADAPSEEVAAPGAEAKMALSDVVTGKEYKGTVKAIAAYGCFVDIGAESDGLVHVSQLANSYVKDVNDFVSVGQEVVVKVLGVEGDKKLALTMKNSDEAGSGDGEGGGKRAPRMRRGKAAVDHGLSVGDTVKGEVMRIAGFGAFLRLPDGFEVLLPTSEMSAAEDLDPNPHKLVSVGTVMDVTVLKVDGGKVSVTAITDEDRASMAEAAKGASSAGASAGVGGSMMSDLAALGLEDIFGEPASK